MPTIHEIAERLVAEFGYSEPGALTAAQQLTALHEDLAKRFQTWWFHGRLDDISVNGYTIERLQSQHAMNVIAAFLTLDWLAREPARALRMLRKGHDRIEK